MTSPQGPNAGQTPSDADELSGNPSPWHTGEKLSNVVHVASSQYPMINSVAGASGVAGPSGYFSNPSADPDNPFHDGAGGYSAAERAARADVEASFDAAIARNLGHGVSPDAPNPMTDAYERRLSVDTGQDDQLIPPGQRR